jgi:GNAT superfamily N-acetyltransferase
MTVTIRRAEESDASDLLALIRSLAEFEKLDPPDAEAMERLVHDGWGPRPRFETWLAMDGSKAAGYLIVYETYSTFLAKPTLYVEDVFLLPEYRGLGIGRALFGHAMCLAKERGCGRMEWCCLDWNVGARRFYEAAGARPLEEWVYYRLTEEHFEQMPASGELDAA